MLAKHKVGSSTLLTRSSFKPLRKSRAFFVSGEQGSDPFQTRFYLGSTCLASRPALKPAWLIVAQVIDGGLLPIRITPP